MIDKNEIFPIGKISKPHGINGEMSFSFTTDVFDTEDAEYFVFEIEGILIPFYIESYRFRTDTTALLKLIDVDTEEQAREFNGLAIHLPNFYLKNVQEDEITVNYFVGFKLFNEKGEKLGVVTDIDQSTENILFIVENASKELLIPANDDFITEINHEQKNIYMKLPEGLLDL